MSDASQPNFNDQLVKALLSDRKSDRRWRNIRFFTVILISVIFISIMFIPRRTGLPSVDPRKPYVALIRLTGAIMPNTNFSARRVVPRLIKAFRDKKAKGVVLVINSPGGSAVQASIIHDKIVQLKTKYKKKVTVLGVDALASGAYLIASAADKIYVNKDTITGSIGVIMSGFGFTGAMEKIGIKRRVYTAGQNKDRLDPFQPVNQTDIKKIHSLLDVAHQNFIADVVKGREGKLRGNKKELFSGDFWTGQTALKLGLVDGTGNLWEVLKKEYNVQLYRNYSIRPSLFQALVKGVDSQLHLGFTSQSGTLKAVMTN